VVLVVAGGLGAGGVIERTVEIFEPSKNAWRFGAQLPEANHFPLK